MDAATPLSRRLRTAGLVTVLVLGCQSTDPKAPVGRGQVPGEPPRPPGPGSPVQGSPVQPAAPVAGQPVGPGGAQQAAYTPGPADLTRALIPEGKPQVKVIAVVGAGTIITEQEVWELVRQRQDKYLTLVDGPQGGTE